MKYELIDSSLEVKDTLHIRLTVKRWVPDY